VPHFSYRGRNARGDLVTGRMEAPDSGVVATQLLNTGVTPVEIKEAAQGGSVDVPDWFRSLTAPPVTDMDVMLFSRQMYTLLKAGIPILRALAGLQESIVNPAFKAVVADLRTSLEAGRELSAALRRHPKVFDNFYVSLVRVGETTGMLDETFNRLFGHIEFERDMRDRIKAAVRYPMIVMVVIAVAVAIINFAVIPAFARIFEANQVALPVLTRVLIWINKMLQDLDRRQGAVEASSAEPPQNTVRAVRTPVVGGGREWFWRVVAGLMVLAVCWVAWLAYQLRPEPIATELAFRAAEEARSAKPAPQRPPEAVKPPAPTPSASVGTESLRLATAIEGPIRERTPAKPPVEGPREVASRAAPPAPPAPPAQSGPQAMSPPAVNSPSATSRTLPPGPVVPGPVAQPAPGPVPALATAPAASVARAAAGAGRVEKRDIARSVSERAEIEFRRAIGVLNQGHASEAEELLGKAIAIDPGHSPARQALIALMLEQKRIDVARRLLQDGLALNPTQAQFALVLARIQVDSRDHAAALAVLQGGLAQGAANAEYMSLLGTVHQRLGMHREAAEDFRAAVRLAPSAGMAWLGMGISLEALERRPEASEAFSRAAASGALKPDMRAFAEARARQLRP
jgi:Tfp pilus assembly protein PilF